MDIFHAEYEVAEAIGWELDGISLRQKLEIVTRRKADEMSVDVAGTAAVVTFAPFDVENDDRTYFKFVVELQR
jgi:hypothetical protein